MDDLQNYISKALESVKPFWALFITTVNYVLFPDTAYVPAAMGLGGAVVLDIVTKYYALSVKNGGLRAAFVCHAINSDNFWAGTKVKMLSYLSIMVLAGLSVRVTMLERVAVFLATVAYSVMFLREAQSVLENLIDAGADWLKPLLAWTKRKQEEVLEEDKVRVTTQIETEDKVDTPTI